MRRTDAKRTSRLMRARHRILCGGATLFAWLLQCASTVHADESVVISKHNLSAAGPGTVRATIESEVCVFCHTPHGSDPQVPLWNRNNPTAYYRIYSSSTTQARIDQPGGASKMCLSCHDGSIALGMVLSRLPNDPIHMNQPFMPTGPSNLTNDLSDDHPIGFRYDRQLANRDHQLRSPDLVSKRVKLGAKGELECVACHDAHNNEQGDFLRITAREGALCRTCHQMDGWNRSSHARSPAPVPSAITRGAPLEYPSMNDAACASCHQTHGAAHPERLLRDRSFELCITCHGGTGGRDILRVMNERSGHRTNRFRDRHDPAEQPLVIRTHVDCVDCHNPHAVRESLFALTPPTGIIPPEVPPAMEFVKGVRLSGSPTEQARLYYEVCFRCHSDNPAPVPRIPRQRDNGGNIRRQVQASAASFHPIAFPARGGAEVPSLLPQARGIVTLTCQSCHNNPDARQLGGTGPNGPHGSRFEYLLMDRYETADFTVESAQAYALCYTCHDRASILADQSFKFHRRHVVDARTPCSACHAAHGVQGSRNRHDHLINFDLTIVGGQRFYSDTGTFSGTCTLTCHGVNHVNFTYGP